jgi:protein disulfide-isomerase
MEIGHFTDFRFVMPLVIACSLSSDRRRRCCQAASVKLAKSSQSSKLAKSRLVRVDNGNEGVSVQSPLVPHSLPLFDAEDRLMRFRWSPLVLFLSVAIAAQAAAQQDAIHWHHDLESAKSMAKESGRLVLIHFWTPTCGPCAALEQNVFNQPGVASAIERVYVPVKLNADENTATAQWYQINRVPMDVVISPDGQLVGKLVSPPTAAAYVAEVTGLANKYASRTGQAYAAAAAAAPVQPQINAAYANLQLSPTTSAPHTPGTPAAATDLNRGRNALGANGVGSTSLAATTKTQSSYGPQTITNSAATAAAAPPTSYSQSSAAAPPTSLVQAPAAAAPAQVANTYIAPSTTPAPAPQTPMPPVVPIPATSVVASQYPPVAAPQTPILQSSGSAASAAQPLAGGSPDLSKLPAGSPPLGFEGYCPVTMRNGWKWVAGNPQWGIVHRGRTYWFAGPEEQKQFWTDPDRYTPALSGMDPVLAMDHQQQIPGKREHSLDYDGLFYMVASEATLQQFTANPQRYAASVRQAMGIPRGRLVR